MSEFKQSGLTSQEVIDRKQQGLGNDFQEDVSKSTTDIVKDNVLTLFNFLNLAIGICLALVGAYSNMVFLAIIAVNIAIGIYQEIHARNMVAKLTIVSKGQTTVIRDSHEHRMDASELVMDDIVKLQAGEQIPTDLTLVSGKVEVNEALLTGESDLIEKTLNDELLSGSFVSSGQCYARVIRVGQDNYATKIATQAKVHKPIQSELVNAIKKVSKFTSFIIIPLGIILFLEGMFIRQSDIKTAVVSSAAALLGMLPKGLVLLISISLATAVTKLAKKRILVQDMYAVETLAHVDTLCLDKTGTITEGKMTVQQVTPFSETSTAQLETIMGNYLANTTDNNITMQAIRHYYPEKQTFTHQDTLAFSSERKWGAVSFKEEGTYFLGAPERLLGTREANEMPLIQKAQENGHRVLVLGHSDESLILENITALPSINCLAVIEIDDPIRKDANKTLAYLHAEGVDLKVISGDNPVTVSNIARRAELPHYDQYIDLSATTTEAEVREAAHEYTVFGRVTPQQKQILVQEFKAAGRVVAMTGDGVNDVLALREADCSIAMAEGDPATRQIANLVLLDSDFTSLPEVLFEGRRVVNNVTKVASIFFIKTIYSFFLSILCAITAVAFPFVPIQITLLDLAIEGYPSFFLSFEENKKQVKGKFLPTVIRHALPNALLVVMNVVIVYMLGKNQGWSELETTTLMYYLLMGVSVIAVIKACLPFNPLRVFLAVTTTVGVYTAAYLFRSILYIGTLTSHTFWPFVVLIVVSLILRLIYDKYFLKEVYYH
ncbi:cation-translocating P-type ATPase [Vagococcus lutrae]|uniref:cation-translocating P-type ATPase n=1 Tax=Vagococcus lutrae TaxID=81947 RepID=UPI00200E74F6|nr:cation-translocating P-type ATPase [Vagococcus lutrae]MDT2801703.1 cation-translocating P-type ATPase [Vagococcus lutrae]MDT2825859.1 cation-translocating P-type ATPase [Vagococcus lutrae]MDT2841227.1 cation-translocating P-type ATPase [Vagococcus lutrae]UQF10891.1 cation-translocating P-type ATPase [Vagococcus lutrae]UQF22878.1 cation-translocating P-type ATPase [Vagococcus lutrae]